MNRGAFLTLPLLAFLLLTACSGSRESGPAGRPDLLRLGYFANLTHAQAVLGVADGSLAQAAGIRIRPKVFTAGPQSITALLAGEIDLLYVGPSPALTAYVRSEGKAVRVLAGSASGGAVFVARPGWDPTNLTGARLATPSLANTQDVALRHLLSTRGLRTREQGGGVRVIPVAPAEMIQLFARGQLDGAWVAEPWGSRIVKETGAVIAWDERDLWPGGRFATTLLVARRDFLERFPDIVRGFLKGHVQITQWIQSHPDEARVRLNQELAALQGKPLAEDVMKAAFSRVEFTYEPMTDSVTAQAERAYKLGFLGARQPDLSGLYDLTLLREVLP